MESISAACLNMGATILFLGLVHLSFLRLRNSVGFSALGKRAASRRNQDQSTLPVWLSAFRNACFALKAISDLIPSTLSEIWTRVSRSRFQFTDCRTGALGKIPLTLILVCCTMPIFSILGVYSFNARAAGVTPIFGLAQRRFVVGVATFLAALCVFGFNLTTVRHSVAWTFTIWINLKRFLPRFASTNAHQILPWVGCDAAWFSVAFILLLSTSTFWSSSFSLVGHTLSVGSCILILLLLHTRDASKSSSIDTKSMDTSMNIFSALFSVGSIFRSAALLVRKLLVSCIY
jgi:hypothetical protein